MKKGLVLAVVAVLVTASAILFIRRPHAPPSPAPAAALQTAGIEGTVVYECGAGVCALSLGAPREILLTPHGRYPRWSPDGRHIAFLRGDKVMRMRADGSAQEILASGNNPGAVSYHSGGGAVLFTDGRQVKSYSFAERAVEILLTGRRFMEIDVSPSGDRLIATVKDEGFRIVAFDLPGGRARPLTAGCSASLSPDGDVFTGLDRSHTRLTLRDWSTGAVRGALRPPAGLAFDNQFWSNHPDWIASRDEGGDGDIYLHQVSTGRAVRITSTGGNDRPDLHLRVPS